MYNVDTFTLSYTQKTTIEGMQVVLALPVTETLPQQSEHYRVTGKISGNIYERSLIYTVLSLKGVLFRRKVFTKLMSIFK